MVNSPASVKTKQESQVFVYSLEVISCRQALALRRITIPKSIALCAILQTEATRSKGHRY